MAVTVDHSKANSVEISTSENTVNIIGPDDNTITITEDKENTICNYELDLIPIDIQSEIENSFQPVPADIKNSNIKF